MRREAETLVGYLKEKIGGKRKLDLKPVILFSSGR